jgi:hypothetical protein
MEITSIKNKKGFTCQIFAQQNLGGFIALITVLIILIITLLIGLSFSLLSINETKMGLNKTQSSQAYFFANLCAEQALMNLKENINYSGNETIVLDNNSCQILPIEGQWIIKTVGSSQNQIKKMRILVSQVNPQMIIESWQEVADF